MKHFKAIQTFRNIKFKLILHKEPRQRCLPPTKSREFRLFKTNFNSTSPPARFRTSSKAKRSPQIALQHLLTFQEVFLLSPFIPHIEIQRAKGVNWFLPFVTSLNRKVTSFLPAHSTPALNPQTLYEYSFSPTSIPNDKLPQHK